MHLSDDRRSKRSVSIDATPNRCRCNVHCAVRPDTVSRVLLETSPCPGAGPHDECRCPPGSARGSAGAPAGGRPTRLSDPCHRPGAQAAPPRVQSLVRSSDLTQTAEATGSAVPPSGVSVCGSADTVTHPTTHRLTLPRHATWSRGREQRCRIPLHEDAGRTDAGAAQPGQASYQREHLRRLARQRASTALTGRMIRSDSRLPRRLAGLCPADRRAAAKAPHDRAPWPEGPGSPLVAGRAGAARRCRTS